jgi:chromosomal replication initiator protein
MTIELNARHRFETLVVGSANRLAATAARAVAEAPGSVYNPLFIYAHPGLGKTHLLMAIGHAARAVNARAVVEYLSLDEFVEAFHAAIAAGQGDAYRRRFVDVDVLLIDDVQFLTHRREMQAELLRLTDALQTAGRQIVLTSDRPPAEIEALDERLIRRFAGGLVIDIAAPDYETRVAILRRRADERKASFGPGVLEAVASLDIDNVRELLGALNRLIAFQAVSDQPLGANQARVLVGGADVDDESYAPAASPPANVLPEATATQPPAASPATASSPPVADSPRDEFSDFLSEVAATLAQQVETWRTRVGEAVLRWEGEGFRTQRLEALLAEDAPADPEATLREFEADIERLLYLQAEVAAIAPDVAGSSILKDPGNLAAAELLLDRAREGMHPPAGPSLLWHLGDFVESPANRMAVHAATTVGAEPGRRYNPLVIVGGSGVGKTHLLHGLGNALAAAADGPVACLSAHDFTAELIDAIDRDSVTAWRTRYRRVSALLLDDVHLLAGRDRTQEELFILFNLLLESGRQMVFASAVPLAQLEGVEARLLTRLEGGLVVELPAPDRELRQQIAERLLAGRADVDPELAGYLASRPAESVRTLQGLAQRVLNAAEGQGGRATAALAREIIEGQPARPTKKAGAGRSSGVVVPSTGGVKSREKMVLEWPNLADRVIEDWR